MEYGAKLIANDLKEAINRGCLVPFNYYGTYDESVNYDKIEFKNGKYDRRSFNDNKVKALAVYSGEKKKT